MAHGGRHKKNTSPLPLIQAQYLCLDLLYILSYHIKFEEKILMSKKLVHQWAKLLDLLRRHM